ncbi:hypothetical protein BKA70DRAFT_1236425 [Coprinopsis sp. MPI-PUGE-AT-0042]|nr:hypothetical protein BKA70DRAFT_1236425 [Coprinopsis sp. MPI-PUGE-AT-0042]
MAPFKQLLLLTSLALAPVARCPAIPSNPLKANSKVPEPFKLAEGRKVTTAADWNCHRAKTPQLFQTYESGTLPPKPQTVTGSLSGNTLSVGISNGGRFISLSTSISFPSSVAIIDLDNDDIADQSNHGSYGKRCQPFCLGHDGLGVGVVLESTGQTHIDAKKLGVTGCFRTGKGDREIYQVPGAPNNIGKSSVVGHEHCQFTGTQRSELSAFVNTFLKSDANADTNIQRTDQSNNLGFVESTWVDWQGRTIS